MRLYPNLRSISQPFDGILLDAYGVFWGGGGVGLLPGCKETMEELVAQGKTIGVLSNASQLSEKEIEKFKKHGLILGTHLHFVITSGTVAKGIFSNDRLPFPTPKKKFYVLGEPHPKFLSHQIIFQDTLFQETKDLEEADFIYISIPHIAGEDQTEPHLFRDYITSFKNCKLPMVCVNPDRFAHEGNPPRAVVRQGSIAAIHEAQGGEVYYIGKPSHVMFDAAIQAFQDFNISDLKKIVMVGDTPETDIRGAKRSGIASALVTKTGIMADNIHEHGLEKALNQLPLTERPDFIIEKMAT